MTAKLLDVRGLVVGAPDAPELGPISFDLAGGKILALLGPNGAGKSTLLRALIGLAPRSAGELRIGGVVTPQRADARAVARLGVGYAPEGRRVFPGLTAAENLEAVADAPRRSRAARMAEIYALFPRLAERRNAEAWRLSGGEQQMLAIGRALMRRPRLLLLDEPSLGLAPIALDALFEAIGRIREDGVAILLAEQSVGRALAIADRAAVLANGKIKAIGSPKDVAAQNTLNEAYLG